MRIEELGVEMRAVGEGAPPRPADPQGLRPKVAEPVVPDPRPKTPDPVVRLTPVLGKVSVNPVPVAMVEGRRRVADLTQEECRQCMFDFFHSGNLSEIARTRNIHYVELIELAKQPWWVQEIQNLEREANAQLKVRLTKMLGQSLDQLENRLTHGDQKWYDQGLQRVPVSARDLATISTVLFDKKRQIEEAETGAPTSEATRLLKLAEALRFRDPVTMEGELVEGNSDGA